MMKKMLLSMQPYWKSKIMTGEKIYEYRSRFPDEEVLAYLYVSYPICGIAGVLHLGKKIFLEDWKAKYRDNSDVIERIEEYESRKNKIAMPVLSFQESCLLSRKQLSDELGRFIVPQSYYYLKEDMELTRYIESNIEYIGEKQYNDFSKEYINEICRNYRQEE